MSTLAGYLGLMILAIIVGRRSRRISPLTYLVIFFIAILQVGFILYRMYTMTEPTM